MQHEDDDARTIRNWEAIATMIEELGRKGLPIQRYKGLGEMRGNRSMSLSCDAGAARHMAQRRAPSSSPLPLAVCDLSGSDPLIRFRKISALVVLRELC